MTALDGLYSAQETPKRTRREIRYSHRGQCCDSLRRKGRRGGRTPRSPIDTRSAPAYSENRMEVNLTPDQKAFVRQAIESGRLHREEDAVQEALSLWEERERTRAEILTAVDVAEASIARGEGRTITQESMRQLADEVKQ